MRWTSLATTSAQRGLFAVARRKTRAPVRTRVMLFAGLSSVGETGFEPATARPPAGCATRLRHSPWLCQSERATGIEPALGAWKAPVQPQHFARADSGGPVYPVRRLRRRCLGRHLARRRRPSAGRRPGAEPVVAGAVERDDRAAERAAERRGEQRDEPGVLLLRPRRWSGTVRAAPAPHRLGVLAQRLGVEVAGGERRRRRCPSAAQSRGELARAAPRPRRGRRSSAPSRSARGAARA